MQILELENHVLCFCSLGNESQAYASHSDGFTKILCSLFHVKVVKLLIRSYEVVWPMYFLLFLFLFMFTALGMEAFADVEVRQDRVGARIIMSFRFRLIAAFQGFHILILRPTLLAGAGDRHQLPDVHRQSGVLLQHANIRGMGLDVRRSYDSLRGSARVTVGWHCLRHGAHGRWPVLDPQPHSRRSCRR